MTYGYSLDEIMENGGDEEWAEDADGDDGGPDAEAGGGGGPEADAEAEAADERGVANPADFSLAERLEAIASLSAGDGFSACVTRLADFGVTVAFYAADVAVCAVCYLPDMSDDQEIIAHPKDIVAVGDRVRVSVVDVDVDTGRLRVCFVDGDGARLCEELAEDEGEIEMATGLAALLRGAEGVVGVEEGLVLQQRQNRGISLQILIDSEESVGGFEVLVRSDGLQQRLFIMTTTLSREEVGNIVKESFAKLTGG